MATEKAPRLPWVKWYPTDWLGDSRLKRAPLEVRGAWNEILQHLFHDQVPSITASLDEWGRVMGCPGVKAKHMLRQLKSREIATVTFRRNGDVMVACRRLEKEHRAKELNRLRVGLFRKKGLV